MNFQEVPNLVESRSVSPEVEAPKSIDIKPLTRSFQMEATFGVTVQKKDSDEKIDDVKGSEDVEEGSEESAESEDDISDKKPITVKPPKAHESPEDIPIKKLATSIKINGIPMKNEEKLEEKEEKCAVRIRIRTEKSPMRTTEKEEVIFREIFFSEFSKIF